ncbi:MAG: DUF1622 domain-containing protein [Chloroflexi bacterium]|nr:DUF1622 domain-containing protein [Chloroflexota bacterium]
MINVIADILNQVSFATGVLAILVIVWGVIIGIAELIRAEVYKFRAGKEKTILLEKVRYDIGFHLLLGLEFLIAADIIRTVVNPTLEELAILGSIVAIRIGISYFLGKEIGRYGDNERGE